MIYSFLLILKLNEMKSIFQMEEDRKIMKISENFRVIALAEPPTLGGSGKGQWLTPEILSMFLFHSMRPLSQEEERAVLSR
jgi:hypothetical protein